MVNQRVQQLYWAARRTEAADHNGRSVGYVRNSFCD
jgi:hypothetical protein